MVLLSVTYISIVILLICPEDKSDKKQDGSHHRQLEHSSHHPPQTCPTRGAQSHVMLLGLRGLYHASLVINITICMEGNHQNRVNTCLFIAIIGRQQQQQQGKGSGETCSPAKISSMCVFPPKKFVMRSMNFSKVIEW